MKKNNKRIDLYSFLVKSPKKLRIVCAWDEVIKPIESYSLWLAKKEYNSDWIKPLSSFVDYFNAFWNIDNKEHANPSKITYSNNDSSLSDWCKSITVSDYSEKILDRQLELKKTANTYQEAPYLSAIIDLLKLLKENKVESLVFCN